MSNRNENQLSDANNYDTKRMIFSDPVAGSVPGNGPAINYSRINISTKYDDGKVGDLILGTERLFSFGVSENLSPDTGKVNGWTMPLCLWNKAGATKSEKAWVDSFNAIVERAIDHILDHKEELDKFDLERSDLKKFNPLYWKKERKMVDGKQQQVVVEGTGPTLYSKLIYSKTNSTFVTKFYDADNQPLDPLDMLGKYSYATGAVKIESIFIGNKISLQVKLYEAVVEPISTGTTRLLRPVAKPLVTQTRVGATAASVMDDDDSDDDDDEGSVEEMAAPTPAPAPAPVKKVVRRPKK